MASALQGSDAYPPPHPGTGRYRRTGLPRLLLVDEDEDFRRDLAADLSSRGFTVDVVATGRDALAAADGGEIDVAILDLRFLDMDGIDLLRKLRERSDPLGAVILTKHGTVDTALRATRLGAHEYLAKPCPMAELELAIRRTHEQRQLSKRTRVMEDGYVLPDISREFVSCSPALETVRRTVDRLGPTDATVLVFGETGVGKEMVAKLLHARSSRTSGPFVVMDCAALQEGLLLSELFGHEKGAFTGAISLKHGLFEVASGGTLFLDEVGEMSLDVQAKLLRVLETGRIRRVGSTRELSVDVRVISATHRDLRKAVTERIFREDLFFRLASLVVTLPPLRERRQDILLLIDHFTERFNRRFGLSKRLSHETLEVLAHYRWPGNVRELIHVLEQSMILCEGKVLEPKDLPSAIHHAGKASALNATDEQPLALRKVQERHIYSVLSATGGNRAKAARILEISERNLYRLLKKYESETK